MIYRVLSSYITMLLLLIILAIGAAAGTFIENDYGSLRAKELVYFSFWYNLALFLTALNIIFVFHKTKMYRVKARTVFHLAFILILIGAAITHFFGFDGLMSIRENNKSNIVQIADKKIEIPFYLSLNNFTLKRYPGSKSPSEFSSDITVIDTKNKKQFNVKIYMNHTLTYNGYKFFQRSYNTDEKGTVLTVNKDPGVEITYTGYALLFLGLILNLFDKKSRFQYLVRKVNKNTIALPIFLILFLSASSISFAQSNSPFIKNYLVDFKKNSKELAAAFGTLVVQSPDGRMKPLDSQNKEVLNKLTGKSTWQGLNANQVNLGILARPELWKKVEIIKTKTLKLRILLGVDKNKKLVKFADFFDEEGNYKLIKEIEKANKLVSSKRGTFERDLIQVDERLNIFFMSYKGILLTIFPLPNSKNNKWINLKKMFSDIDNSQLKRNISDLLEKTYNRKYTEGLKYIESIRNYQQKFGSAVIPPQNKLYTEIWFNKTFLFVKLFISYLLFGFLLLIYGLIFMFYNKKINKKTRTAILVLSILLLAVHTFGIGIRWYIGGFIPITNTYETMIYIAYSSVVAGVFFLRKSTMALAASLMMAGIFIFSAYLGEINPVITSLVPVLKSYWLSIHVSVITASYGFFGVGAILGIITLLLFILKNNNRLHIDNHIKNLTYINEITLSLGLVLLVIGNFLGGIWANESWGRYWGWDPKETWAYISIIVYTIVLHMRLLKKYYSAYLFSVLSILAFFSILMTYFGVNFYLAGMHSYATGDPVSIPNWVFYITSTILLLVMASYLKKRTYSD